MRNIQSLAEWNANDFRVLARILSVALGLLGLAAIFNLAGISSIGSDGVKTGMEVMASLEPNQALNAAALPAEVNPAGQPIDVYVAVEPSGLAEQVLVRVIHLPVILVIMAVVVLIRRIFVDAAKNLVFTQANAGRLRKIAFLLLCTVFLEYVSQVARNELAQRALGGDLVVVTFGFSALPMGVAALTMALAAIFDRGVALREYNEVTV